MTYEIISIHVEVTRQDLVNMPREAVEANLISKSVRALAMRLLEDDLVFAKKEYNIERDTDVHTFAVRVEKP